MLYSTVGVLRRSDLRRRPFEARGRLVCPILSQQRASLRATLIINPRSRYLKFFESLIAIGSHGNVYGMSISGLAARCHYRQPLIAPRCTATQSALILSLSRFTGRTMDSHDTFPRRVWQIVASIPEGYVATYGDIARLAGSPRAARQVGGVLKRLPEGSTLPWHRVVNRHGDISLTGPDLQRQRQALLAEGVQVSGSGHIDLQHYRWIY